MGTADGRDAQRPPRIRILLSHDHVALREALREALTARGEFDVIGESATSEEATALCANLQPDVLLLDAGLPGPPPEITVGRIRSVAEHTAVLVLGGFGTADTAGHLLRIGASGYLHRVTSLELLCAAIRSAAPGRRGRPAASPSALTPAPPDGELLSPRERELLTLVAQALSNREIAAQLNIAEGTVKRHLRNIFGKLNASSRLDAVNKAFAKALVPAPDGVAARPLRAAAPPRTQAVVRDSCITVTRGTYGPAGKPPVRLTGNTGSERKRVPA
ncbi:LuxR C-terminal-related transcriptional regulator [Streptomyces melanogenes]|uniref:LuxR C-terminal-related transcriptional regulator n=1 Tax=Streptomyces melanogenes TaxID=67326 RepID=UPI00167CC5E4|nr:response regulator transcription factor [Streptomyces melanogenes]GGP94706.1 DNA-binding response regulator [Streptomyces melanogenes]